MDIVDSVNPVWLCDALLFCRDRIINLAPEGTQKNLNGPIVKKIELEIPPIELQLEYLEKVEKLHRLSGTVIARRSEIDNLVSTLQARAFRGEL